MKIYIRKNGIQTSAFTRVQIIEMLRGGQISIEDLASHDEEGDFQPLQNLLRIPTPPPVPIASSSQSRSHSRQRKAHVGGWLLLFCIILTIVAPTLSIIRISLSFVNIPPHFWESTAIKNGLIFELAACTALVVYGLSVGVIIWRGSPRGREIAQRFLIIRLVLMVAIELITGSILATGGLKAEVMAGITEGIVKNAVQSIVFFVIWWSYFKTSKRVANTYCPSMA